MSVLLYLSISIGMAAIWLTACFIFSIHWTSVHVCMCSWWLSEWHQSVFLRRPRPQQVFFLSSIFIKIIIIIWIECIVNYCACDCRRYFIESIFSLRALELNIAVCFPCVIWSMRLSFTEAPTTMNLFRHVFHVNRSILRSLNREWHRTIAKNGNTTSFFIQ